MAAEAWGRVEWDSGVAGSVPGDVLRSPARKPLGTGVSLFLPPVSGMERGIGDLHFGSGPLWSRQGLASRSGRRADQQRTRRN